MNPYIANIEPVLPYNRQYEVFGDGGYYIGFFNPADKYTLAEWDSFSDRQRIHILNQAATDFALLAQSHQANWTF